MSNARKVRAGQFELTIDPLLAGDALDWIADLGMLLAPVVRELTGKGAAARVGAALLGNPEFKSTHRALREAFGARTRLQRLSTDPKAKKNPLVETLDNEVIFHAVFGGENSIHYAAWFQAAFELSFSGFLAGALAKFGTLKSAADAVTSAASQSGSPDPVNEDG
jgi:hypothetical protein